MSLAVQVLHVAGGQLQRVRLVADDAGQPVHEVRGLQVSHQLLDLRLDILKLADRLPVAHLEQGFGEILLDGAQLSLALDLIAVFQLEHQVDVVFGIAHRLESFVRARDLLVLGVKLLVIARERQV